MVLIAMVGFVFVANAQQAKKNIQGDYGNTVIASVSDDGQSYTSITFYNNSTKDIEVCVAIYNDQGSKLGENCYTISGAAQGTTKRISKPVACGSATSGCETKGIEIKSAKVKE